MFCCQLDHQNKRSLKESLKGVRELDLFTRQDVEK